ncbi:MAG: Asp-tRNA(Asn)/Glu-tRNA(Gln) amidotransferase subunit GatC [Methanomicrobiales archaeon]|nr:Asp-tRNA(Asn)/Glu-tRNA(Gln) amidotransferase subunit GatC [Methanomicrobiales archaeon]
MVSEEEVLRIAELADIGIGKEELPPFTRDFNAILDYFAVLDRVPPGEGWKAGIANVLREDRVTPSLPQEEVLALAEAAEDGYIRAPRVM